MRSAPALLLVSALACVQPGEGTPRPEARTAPDGELSAVDVPARFYRTFEGTIGGRPAAIVLRREADRLSGWYADEGRAWVFGGIDSGLAFELEEESGAAIVGRLVAEPGEPWRIEGERRPPDGAAEPVRLVEERAALPGGGWIVSRDVFDSDSARGWSFYAQVPAPAGATATTYAPLFDSLAGGFEAARADFAGEHAEPPDSFAVRLMEDGVGSYYEASYEVALAEAGVVALAFAASTYYLGAAHPNHYTWSIVWDVAAGERMELADAFRGGVDGIAWVSQRAIARLEASGLEMTDSDWIREGAGPDPENFASWVPTPDGIRLTFDPYQVAAYAAGAQEVVIGWAEIAPVLDPAGPLAAVAAARAGGVP